MNYITLNSSESVIANESSIQINYPCENSALCFCFKAIIKKGVYLFELWGASGGEHAVNTAGLGGYTKATISLFRETTSYLCVGQKGSVSPVGYIAEMNFGGGGGGISDGGYLSSSGGGSTDVRFKGTSLYHRVIVAAGGGGAGRYPNKNIIAKGGYGGGLEGGNGDPSTYLDHEIIGGKGATQISPGIGYGMYGSSYHGSKSGTFGYGAYETYIRNYGCGGGGGWYGGSNGHDTGAGGGGGSSFVLTRNNYNATVNRQVLGYYFSDPEMKSGVNKGDGKIVITYVMAPKLCSHNIKKGIDFCFVYLILIAK